MNRSLQTLRNSKPLLNLASKRAASSLGPDKVQTPIQSVPKDKIASPGRQPAEAANATQTPIQSQPPSTPPTDRGPTLLDPLPLITLVGGLIGGSIFVYYYYHHRKEHMERKWANMLKEAEEKRGAS